MDMGQKIKFLREQKGMTLEELGDKVGVGKSTVRKWETGIIANMKRDKIAKIANALGVTPSYLMGWDENDNSIKDIQNSDHQQDPDIRRIERARQKMPEEDRKFMMDMLTRSFSAYFEDDGADDPD